jgi:hypothetical protein
MYRSKLPYLHCLALLSSLALASCNRTNHPAIPQGILTYSIEYPDHKDQFFLYGLLPKEMKLSYKGPKMEIKILKNQMENTLVVDNQSHQMLAYFKYDAPVTSVLQPADVQAMFSQDPAFDIRYTDETKQIIGFNAHKAIATNPLDKSESVEIWYTDELPGIRQQWFGPYRNLQATILCYTLKNHGIRMVFTAQHYEDVPVPDSIVTFERPGRPLSYADYDHQLSELFESFQ